MAQSHNDDVSSSVYALQSQSKQGDWYTHEYTDDLEEAKQWVISWSEEYKEPARAKNEDGL